MYKRQFLGYPYYSHHDTFLHNDYHNDDQMPQRSFYRWHIMDPVPVSYTHLRIVGLGRHEELLAGCEAYQEIYYSQMDREVSAS